MSAHKAVRAICWYQRCLQIMPSSITVCSEPPFVFETARLCVQRSCRCLIEGNLQSHRRGSGRLPDVTAHAGLAILGCQCAVVLKDICGIETKKVWRSRFRSFKMFARRECVCMHITMSQRQRCMQHSPVREDPPGLPAAICFAIHAA